MKDMRRLRSFHRMARGLHVNKQVFGNIIVIRQLFSLKFISVEFYFCNEIFIGHFYA